MGLDTIAQSLELGRGRSGIVFKGRNAQGDDIAIKVFTGDPPTNAIHYVRSGAPNPYIWDENAVYAAYYSRKVLEQIVRYWFGSRLRVAKALGVGWNNEFKAYELQTEFIDGRNARLHSPFSKTEELSDLVENIMKPLQRHLVEAGFDGVAWQAGLGNPVATNNFLLEENGNWVWVDMESGVPALPFSLFYAEKLNHFQVLFDDADIKKLRVYLETNRVNITEKIGHDKYFLLLGDVGNLDMFQQPWKTASRSRRGVIYNIKRENISEKEARFYFKFPLAWYAREGVRLTGKAVDEITAGLWWKAYDFATFNVYRFLKRKGWKVLFSREYRQKIAEEYTLERSQAKRKRNQLEGEDAGTLEETIKSGKASPYLGDFIMHVALNPAFKIVEYVGIPLLRLLGLIDNETMGILLGASVVFGGVAQRTIYTTGRIIESYITDSEKPWVALGWGFFPKIGNAAYPLQMVYSGSREDDKLAKFVLYDTFAQIGERAPIIGGKDSRIEHFFNNNVTEKTLSLMEWLHFQKIVIASYARYRLGI